MGNLLLQDIESKLTADPDGSYKYQLIELLREYEQALSDSKHQLLLPEEYDYLEHLGSALHAAIRTILNYNPVKIKSSEDIQVDSFNNIFNI